MSLVEGHHLLSQEDVDNGDGVIAGRVRSAVVRSINGGEGIFARKSLVEPRRSEVLAHAL